MGQVGKGILPTVRGRGWATEIDSEYEFFREALASDALEEGAQIVDALRKPVGRE